MSNKLTRETFEQRTKGQDWDADWEMIQDHTAECVAEAVAEAIKNRYEIGETVEVRLPDGEWHGTYITPATLVNYARRNNPNNVRRPVKTRKMTDEELISTLHATGVNAGVSSKLSLPTLEAMAKDLGIALEVSDE